MTRTAIKWVAIGFVTLLILLGVALLGMNTQPGHRFVLRQLAGFSTATGLTISAQKIDGSIYGRMALRGVTMRDREGIFLTAPLLVLEWQPFAYLNGKIDMRELSARQINLLRSPQLVVVEGPLLPDIDVSIDKLLIERLAIAPAVTGREHIVRIAGRAAIADGRAQINARANALTGPGLAGGDQLALELDAVPDANRLSVNLSLVAPVGGLVESYSQLDKALLLKVDGRGDWHNWAGTTRASLGGAPLLRLAVGARNGTITAKGPANAGLLLSGPSARLLAPLVDFDLVAKLANRRADTRLQMRSGAMQASAVGIVDLGRSQFNALRIDARLIKPGALADNLRGDAVVLAAIANGAFAKPQVDYRITARAIGFGSTAVQNITAAGRIIAVRDQYRIPVAAKIGRVTGLNAAAGGLLTNLSVDGDLIWSGARIVSDNLHLRSRQIDTTAIVIADLGTGRYTGAIKGRVNDYEVDGLGRIDVSTDAKLIASRAGYGIGGGIRIVTRRIDNSSVRDQLGGTAIITAQFGFDPAGTLSVQNVRMASPGLQISGGSGRYLSSGRIDFRLQGRSRQYGRVTLFATGTITRPDIRLRATSPNVGIPLTNVEARVLAVAGGYQIVATGGSPYGPVSADLLIRTGRNLTVDIRRGRFAGADFSGQIVQTGADPFAGTLNFAGSGLRGYARLSPFGKFQRIDAVVNANGARIPAPQPISIGTGDARAVIILYPGAPAINADARLANVSQGTLTLTAAQARVRYQNGRGTAAAVVSGQSGAPFTLAGQAALESGIVKANVRGVINGIALRLEAPAIIRKTRGSWSLEPARVILPKGNLLVSGRYGAGIQANAKLDNVDLSLARAFAPSLGLGGKVSGTVDYATARGAPTGSARLTINRFTRTAAYTVSAPVDIVTLATLSANGADVRALVKSGNSAIGRLQARMSPFGAGGTLASKIQSAPLSGGIRYNGPAEVLWTLTGIADQQLSGPVIVAADFGGRANQPTLTGVVRGNALRYENQTYGTIINAIALSGNFTRSRFQIASLTGRAGKGSITGRGFVGLDAAAGFPIDLALILNNAQLARSDALGATATGTLNIVNGANGGKISGDIELPEARYQIIRQGAADVAELSGIRRKNQLPVTRQTERSVVPSQFALDMRIRASNEIVVSGMGLEAEWSTDMRVTGNAADPVVRGRLDLVRGTYSFAGRRFDLDNNGRILFNGDSFINPEIDLVARTSVEGVSAQIDISGRAQNPQIVFNSTPALPQDEVLSRLLFGSSVTSLSPTQGIQLAAALASLRGSGGGLNPLGKLRSATGLSRLRILGADKTAGRGTALAAGAYISNKIYVEVITDARGFTATQLEVGLSKVLSILGQTGSFGGTNASLRYSKDY